VWKWSEAQICGSWYDTQSCWKVANNVTDLLIRKNFLQKIKKTRKQVKKLWWNKHWWGCEHSYYIRLSHKMCSHRDRPNCNNNWQFCLHNNFYFRFRSCCLSNCLLSNLVTDLTSYYTLFLVRLCFHHFFFGFILQYFCPTKMWKSRKKVERERKEVLICSS